MTGRVERWAQTCFASATLWVIYNEIVLVKALCLQTFRDYYKETVLETDLSVCREESYSVT